MTQALRFFVPFSLFFFLVSLGFTASIPHANAQFERNDPNLQSSQFINDEGPAGIVPCGDDLNGNGRIDPNEQCNICHLGALAQDSLNFAVYATVFIATLMFVYAGFKYITAGGSSSKIEDATKIFGKVIGGMIIVLLSWVIINTFLNAFLEKKIVPWNQIECSSSESLSPSSSSASQRLTETTAPTLVVVEGGCTNCEAISSRVPFDVGLCAGGDTCQVSKELNTRLFTFAETLEEQYGINDADWEITKIDASTSADSTCFRNGTCVEGHFMQNITVLSSDVAEFQRAAQTSGLRAIYNVATQAEKQTLIKSGLNAEDVQVDGSVEGPFFSIVLN